MCECRTNAAPLPARTLVALATSGDAAAPSTTTSTSRRPAGAPRAPRSDAGPRASSCCAKRRYAPAPAARYNPTRGDTPAGFRLDDDYVTLPDQGWQRIAPRTLAVPWPDRYLPGFRFEDRSDASPRRIAVPGHVGRVTVRQVAETSIREIVGKNKMDYVLYEGRDKVAFETQQLMQLILDRYASGVLISNVTLQAVQPPEQVQGAFDDAVKAGQDLERQKNEGQAYANDVIPKARGYASRLLQEAEAYRSMVTENATGNAARFKQVLVEYQKAPGVTRDRMYLDTMQQIFANTSKVMVDSKAGSNLLYLPLDKLIAQVAATEAQRANVTAPPPSAVLLPPPEQSYAGDQNRARESSRSREGR